VLCVCVCVWCGAHAAKSAHSRRRRLHLWISHRVDSISYSVAGRRAIALLFFFLFFFYLSTSTVRGTDTCERNLHAHLLRHCHPYSATQKRIQSFRPSQFLQGGKSGKSTLEKWRTQSVQHRFVDIHVKNHRRNLRDRWYMSTRKRSRKKKY
jgi:hypothetical protein